MPCLQLRQWRRARPLVAARLCRDARSSAVCRASGPEPRGEGRDDPGGVLRGDLSGLDGERAAAEGGEAAEEGEAEGEKRGEDLPEGAGLR